MTIPVSSVTKVSIAIGATFPERRGFGTLNIVTAETGVIGPAEGIRFYSDADGVAADWPSDSEVVKAANSYLGQQPKPTRLAVSFRADTAVGAELRGGSVTDNAAKLAEFTAVSDGEFTITVDGTSADVTSIDYSSATDLANVASITQTALQAADVSFSAHTVTYEEGRFFVRSSTTGASSTISFVTALSAGSGTDASSLLQLRQGEATKSNGLDAETITESLDRIEQASGDWYGLTFTKEVRDGVSINGENAVEAAAAWVQARVKVFFNTSNDLDVLDSLTTNDIISTLNDANYNRTLSTFSSHVDEYPSASVAGRAFTVDFSQPDSTITLKFKSLPGITVEKLTTNQKSVLDSKRGNAFIDVGGTNIYAESYMAGDFFFDTIHGTDWLQDAVQKEVFGYQVSRTTKIPYTDKGTAALEQQVIKVLDTAVLNGLGAPGTTVDGRFLGKGYETVTIPVADASATEKQNRQYNGLSFVLIGAGALHGVQIQGTFER